MEGGRSANYGRGGGRSYRRAHGSGGRGPHRQPRPQQQWAERSEHPHQQGAGRGEHHQPRPQQQWAERPPQQGVGRGAGGGRTGTVGPWDQPRTPSSFPVHSPAHPPTPPRTTSETEALDIEGKSKGKSEALDMEDIEGKSKALDIEGKSKGKSEALDMGGKLKALLVGKVSIWWDLENCPIPENYNDAHKISCRIFKSLRDLGYSGGMSFYAFGDANQFSEDTHKQLNSSGIVFIHVPCGKDATNMQMVNYMMLWASDNPSPASYLLISGDMDFKYALERLKTKNYRIMLAAQMFSYDASSVADLVWDFNDLIQGRQPRQN